VKVDSGIEILNALDPKCQELEALGYAIIGESWGAHLRLSQPPSLDKYLEKISRLHSSCYQIKSLAPGFADQVLELEMLNNPDYPYTPDTAHDMPTSETIGALWKPGSWVFGAFKEELLIGAGATSKKADEINMDFGSVRREHRGLGVGSAIASLAIITHANLGERLFSTGGAAANQISQSAVRSLGFVVDEHWRSYKR
jgi:GNAT superfamily N-acetyltransferase